MAFGPKSYHMVQHQSQYYFITFVFASVFHLKSIIHFLFLSGAGGPTRSTTERGKGGRKNNSYKKNQDDAHSPHSGKKAHDEPQYSCNYSQPYLGMHTLQVSFQEHHTDHKFFYVIKLFSLRLDSPKNS